MRKLIMTLTLAIGIFISQAQLAIQPGANWVTGENANLVLENIAFINNGAFASGLGRVHFTGGNTALIGGAGNIQFHALDINKGVNANMTLSKNIFVTSAINFISGSLNLNNNIVILAATASLTGESETSRVIGANGGYVEVTRNMNAPNGTNAGGLGAFITSSANLGWVTVRRGHVPVSGTGLSSSINRYYDIVAQNNGNLNATLRLRYFDAELNGQSESALGQFASVDGGANWQNNSATSRSTSSNFVERTGLNSLSFVTLSNDASSGSVTGLTFSGTRKKTTEVQLSWTTATENNLNYFTVERRLDNEQAFTAKGNVNSQAPNGTSATPLSYKFTDPNTHTGSSNYRLKIVDKNGGFTYSNEIIIAAKSASGGGKGKPNNLMLDETGVTSKLNAGLAAMEKSIKVGPNPNNGNFWFNLAGMDKLSGVTLYSVDGKILKQYRANNFERIQVTGLSRGIYLLKAEELEPVKVIVQ
jgi:hypothetical protein